MTAQERDQIAAIVRRTCAEQGIPLQVPPDVARAIASMLVVRRKPKP
jgi:hypothetical protein